MEKHKAFFGDKTCWDTTIWFGFPNMFRQPQTTPTARLSWWLTAFSGENWAVAVKPLLVDDCRDYTLGPFLASFMVSSWRVCRTIWTPQKIPMGLSRTILLCDKNPLKIIRNYMRNTKNTIKHLWNYLQNQTKSLGTIWKNTQNSTGIMLKLIKIWRGLHDICLHFRPEPKILIFFRGTTLKY